MMIYDMILMTPRRGILIYIYIYYMMVLQDDILYDSIIWWWDIIKTWIYGYGYVVLRASMDGPRWGRIWGDIMILLIEAVIMGDVSSGREVEVSPWYITHGRHTQVNTSVGTVYDIFWFSWYKNLYVLWFLTSSWPNYV